MADYTLKRLYENALQSIPKLGWGFPISKEGFADERILLEKLTNGTYEDKVNIGGWPMSSNSTRTVNIPSPSTIERIDKIVIYDDDEIEHDMSWLYCDQFISNLREIGKTGSINTGESYAGMGYHSQLVAFGRMTASNYPSAPSFTRYSGAEHALSNAGYEDQYYIDFSPAQLADWGGTINASNCFLVIASVSTNSYNSYQVFENRIHVKITNAQPFTYYIFRQGSSSLTTTPHSHTVSDSALAGIAYRAPMVGYRFNKSTGLITLYHNARADSQSIGSGAPGTGVLSRFVGTDNRGVIYFRRNFTS